MLTGEMITLIEAHTAGAVATIDNEGAPAVSPKATFVVVDGNTIAYGDIRSPGTRANIQREPRVEVCFLDVLRRKAVRARGRARSITPDDADAHVRSRFEAVWSEYLPLMTHFVIIRLDHAELVHSPAYDVGYTEAQLIESNRKRLIDLNR